MHNMYVLICNTAPANHNLVFTQSYYIKILKTPICLDPCGIIIRESIHKMILYKTLNKSFVSG
jgi:hypothetical protein